MTVRPKDPKTRASGFTLLEILIAIAILAVVLSSLYGAFMSSVEATEQVESARDVEQAARLALMQMADDFKSLYYREYEGEPENSPYRFHGDAVEPEEGESKIAEFASTAHVGFDLIFPNPRVNRILYLLKEKTGEARQHRLIRKERALAEVSGELEETSVVLVEGVQALSVEYSDAEGQVTSEWDSSEPKTSGQLPRLVNIRLQISTGESGESRVYTMTVALPFWEEAGGSQ